MHVQFDPQISPCSIWEPHLTQWVIKPHKCTCQMASKSVEWFKQGARVWQTTDRQTDRATEKCVRTARAIPAKKGTIENPSQSYRASPATWDHTVLPATRHRWTCPTLTSAMQASTWFTYPGGMEGWVELGGGYTSLIRILNWAQCRGIMLIRCRVLKTNFSLNSWIQRVWLSFGFFGG